jgi:hypothetical protein
MKVLRYIALASLLTAMQVGPTLQAQKVFTSYLTGNGTASESDRSQALSEATEQAQSNASSPCIGNVVATSTLSSNCTPLGSGDNLTYMCMVTVRVTCQFQSNPK